MQKSTIENTSIVARKYNEMVCGIQNGCAASYECVTSIDSVIDDEQIHWIIVCNLLLLQLQYIRIEICCWFVYDFEHTKQLHSWNEIKLLWYLYMY